MSTDTISEQVPQTVVIADGSATKFSYSFYAPDVRDVYVASGGSGGILVDESEWKAVKVSDGAGYIQFNTAPASGTELTIYRYTPMTQETTWQQGQAFYADTIQSAFNKLTMITQEIRSGSVNVPGTVVTAHSATYATSATYAGSAASAGSAGYAGHALNADMATSALYRGAFRVDLDPDDDPPYFQINGGKVCANGSMYDIPTSSALYQGGNKTVYLVGSSAVGSAPVFSYTTTEPTSATGQFYAPIASYSGGVMTQMQMGNIVDTSWGTGGGGGGSGDVNYASSAGVASNLVASAAEQIVSGAVDSAASASIIGCNYGSDSAVAWKNRTELVIGSSGAYTYYTTSDTASGGRTKLGDGLGGVIAGFIMAPDDATNGWSLNATIGSAGDFTLLQPRQESCTVTSGGTSFTGYFYAPKNGFVSIPVGANTDFHVYLVGGTSKGETHLYFYPNTRKE